MKAYVATYVVGYEFTRRVEAKNLKEARAAMKDWLERGTLRENQHPKLLKVEVIRS